MKHSQLSSLEKVIALITQPGLPVNYPIADKPGIFELPARAADTLSKSDCWAESVSNGVRLFFDNRGIAKEGWKVIACVMHVINWYSEHDKDHETLTKADAFNLLEDMYQEGRLESLNNGGVSHGLSIGKTLEKAV